MENTRASDLLDRSSPAPSPEQYELTPVQLEDGPQQPTKAHLPPTVASSPTPQTSFDSIDSEAERAKQVLGLGCADQKSADKKSLQQLAADHPLPQPKHGDVYNSVRYYHLGTYQRLFVADLLINLIAIIICAVRKANDNSAVTYKGIVTAVSVNILVALLMRQEMCINMLFYSVLRVPHSWSLRIRRLAAKIYCYGGLHPSSGISAVLWYIFFVVLLLKGDYKPVDDDYTWTVVGLSIIILCVLVILCMLSIPPIRSKYHNLWELTHRYGGWACVALIWAQLCCIVASDSWRPNTSMGLILVQTPAFWIVCFITVLLILPWLRLRKVYFTATKLSTHAIQLKFESKKPLEPVVGIGLSQAPLVENHKFATIPNPNNMPGYSIIIANAGDWTKRLIDNPPAYLWTRGIPTLGVAKCALLFKRVVLVATGSGIGPLMSYFNGYPQSIGNMRIVWSARLPFESYGPENLANVLRADPDAQIIDTKKAGMKDADMPSLTELTYAEYVKFNAEAVVIISNPTVTREVVLDLEKRKVPAFGAIFDS